VIRRHRVARNRDITLTTLIDLLVQVIFVFALILTSVDAVGHESSEPGWVTPEVWKTLISIFDVDPRNLRDARAQVDEIRGKVDEIKGKYDKARDDLAACDARTGACDRPSGRGPGNPPCRNSAGIEMVVAEATIDRDGNIVVALGRHAEELQGRQPLSAAAFGPPLSVEQFGSLFRSWREYGLAHHPPCAFKAEVHYDGRARAGAYEPARRAIASYFTLSAPPRRL
jgi:hypothetical protein